MHINICPHFGVNDEGLFRRYTLLLAIIKNSSRQIRLIEIVSLFEKKERKKKKEVTKTKQSIGIYLNGTNEGTRSKASNFNFRLPPSISSRIDLLFLSFSFLFFFSFFFSKALPFLSFPCLLLLLLFHRSFPRLRLSC